MPNSLTRTQQHTIIIDPTLLAFEPRQVQLASLDMKHSNPNGTKTRSPDQKGPLLYAVARFLESNGFSKTLKKFRSEADLEKDGAKDSLLDLEEMYCKYSGMCTNRGTNVNSQKEKEELKEPDQLLEEVDKNCNEKMKKKSRIASALLAGVTKENLKEAAPLKAGVSDSETEKKPKDEKKKKNKSSSDSVSASVEQHGLEGKKYSNGIGKSIADDNPVDEKSVKPKGKKKKKDGLISESLGGVDVKVLGLGDTNGTSSRKDDFKISDVDATDKENKGSKKRKRLASEGNNSQPADNREDEESKRQKVEGLKASKGSEQPPNSDASLGRAENVGSDSRAECGQVVSDVSQEASVTQSDGQANLDLEKSAEKSSIKQSMKKQRNGSAEPKSVNAFQRVKVDEVEFVDEKLKDNSYWAKDGAEIGYGAKAQEILGQVRGRDFRHEKTKKKRGTYRGGQIDLQSYSVKFNYSDED